MATHNFSFQFLAEAEAQNPGSRQWLASGHIIRHSERHDFEEFPCGPPADVLDGEYDVGGSKAVYVEGVDGEATTFKPNRLDLRFDTMSNHPAAAACQRTSNDYCTLLVESCATCCAEKPDRALSLVVFPTFSILCENWH